MSIIPECVSLLNGTLGHKRYAVVILWVTLMDAVPMDRYLHAFHVIFHIDDDLIIFAHLDARSGYHSIGGQNTTFHAIGQHTLAMTPYGVGSVWRTHLACAAKKEVKIRSRWNYITTHKLRFTREKKVYLGTHHHKICIRSENCVARFT